MFDATKIIDALCPITSLLRTIIGAAVIKFLMRVYQNSGPTRSIKFTNLE